jgi:hypothetical protein
MDHAALPLDWDCLQRLLIRKSARSALTSINSNNRGHAQSTGCASARWCSYPDKQCPAYLSASNSSLRNKFQAVASLTVLSRIESQKSIRAKLVQLGVNEFAYAYAFQFVWN